MQTLPFHQLMDQITSSIEYPCYSQHLKCENVRLSDQYHNAKYQSVNFDK